MAIWGIMRLSVFFAPFAVKGLTNSKSASERFKVRGQGPAAHLPPACRDSSYVGGGSRVHTKQG